MEVKLLENFFPQLIIDKIDDQLEFWSREKWQEKITLLNQDYLTRFQAMFHRSVMGDPNSDPVFSYLQVLNPLLPYFPHKMFNYRDESVAKGIKGSIWHINIQNVTSKDTGYLLPNNW